MLWRKLTRAMLVIGRERTIATAAHEADFADAAHITRTFYQKVGIAPSVLMRGEFFEIPSPSEVPVASEQNGRFIHIPNVTWHRASGHERGAWSGQ